MGREPYDAQETKAATYNFSNLYSALSQESAAQGNVQSLRVKPKHHLMVELGEYMKHAIGDPSKFWAYQDEDFVGMIAKLALSRGCGRIATTTPLAVFKRYNGLTAQGG